MLDFFRNLSNSFNDSKVVQSFINELRNSLGKNEQGILEQVQNASVVSKNTMKNKRSEILKNHADGDTLYFISSKSENKYITFKEENGKETIIKLAEDVLPQNVGINSVLREKNGKYILDEIASKEITKEIKKMTEEVLEKQNKELEEYRKEGHLYQVQEDVKERIYLIDITDKKNFAIEEVEFPKDLLEEATEGTIFQYSNGKYHFHSRN